MVTEKKLFYRKAEMKIIAFSKEDIIITSAIVGEEDDWSSEDANN